MFCGSTQRDVMRFQSPLHQWPRTRRRCLAWPRSSPWSSWFTASHNRPSDTMRCDFLRETLDLLHVKTPLSPSTCGSHVARSTDVEMATLWRIKLSQGSCLLSVHIFCSVILVWKTHPGSAWSIGAATSKNSLPWFDGGSSLLCSMLEDPNLRYDRDEAIFDARRKDHP